MLQGPPFEARPKFAVFSLEEPGNSSENVPETQPFLCSPSQQEEHSPRPRITVCELSPRSQQRVTGGKAPEMAVCYTERSPGCSSVAANPVGERPQASCVPSLSTAGDSFRPVSPDRSMGHQMRQLSFDLKEQLHVDTKRTRTGPSCCSLCKSPQTTEGPSRCTADKTPSGLLTGELGGSHSPLREPENKASPAAAAPAEAAEAPAAAGQPRAAGDDCCLTCSCPCHNGSNSGSKIVCFEGPRRPPTFAANLADLCKAFPSVHQGLIVSLLETADNDLQRAHALVRVVSDTNTGLYNPKSGGPMAKRKRWPDDCFDVLEGPLNTGSSRRGSGGMDIAEGTPSGAFAVSDQQQALHSQPHPAGVAPSTTSVTGAAPSATGSDSSSSKGTGGGVHRAPVVLGRELLPESWCDEVAERLLWAIVTAASGDDAKAKAAALLKEHAQQLAHAQRDEPSQAELAKEAERQELAKRVELLQNDKLLLARAVKAQHEKLQTLQQSLAAKTEEARYLVQELSGAQQRLRSLRDAASALLLGAATGRNNSPCRDNTFDRRFPDVY